LAQLYIDTVIYWHSYVLTQLYIGTVMY